MCSSACVVRSTLNGDDPLAIWSFRFCCSLFEQISWPDARGLRHLLDRQQCRVLSRTKGRLSALVRQLQRDNSSLITIIRKTLRCVDLLAGGAPLQWRDLAFRQQRRATQAEVTPLRSRAPPANLKSCRSSVYAAFAGRVVWVRCRSGCRGRSFGRRWGWDPIGCRCGRGC